MGRISGQGGYWVVNGTTQVHNSEYDVETDTVIDEVTDSSSQEVAEGEPILVKVNSVTMTVVERDEFYLTALGLEEGSRANIYLRRGAVAQWDLVSNTIIRSVRHNNPQDKARRITITCEYGTLTRNVAAPGGFA